MVTYVIYSTQRWYIMSSISFVVISWGPMGTWCCLKSKNCLIELALTNKSEVKSGWYWIWWYFKILFLEILYVSQMKLMLLLVDDALTINIKWPHICNMSLSLVQILCTKLSSLLLSSISMGMSSHIIFNKLQCVL